MNQYVAPTCLKFRFSLELLKKPLLLNGLNVQIMKYTNELLRFNWPLLNTMLQVVRKIYFLDIILNVSSFFFIVEEISVYAIHILVAIRVDHAHVTSVDLWVMDYFPFFWLTVVSQI